MHEGVGSNPGRSGCAVNGNFLVVDRIVILKVGDWRMRIGSGSNRTHTLVRQFAAMLDARDAAPLPDWLDQLAASGLSALASLANAIREDQPAVQGITTPFNSGVNEGRITDLKLQKRIMAGVTERHRRTVAQPRFTKILPGSRSGVRRHHP
ncbi:hypothetical protein OG496_54685 [Streptomyces sp. NBC_00988]|uniref:hypothetical protein n=1 Tax=Streptomyces sp. NBC_00988 TaxID=2903704 RepID=UPI0038693AD3|nr:hypothetical protein OG496_54685 [Streptomyces sp. NBC_00988]